MTKVSVVRILAVWIGAGIIRVLLGSSTSPIAYFFFGLFWLVSIALLIAAVRQILVQRKAEQRIEDLGRVLLACEEHSEQAVREAQAPVEPEVELSEAERERAMELLRDPNLIERICADFERVGVVGEQDNCLLGYLAAVSRKLDHPLAVIVQSTSAAGKSALQEAVLAMVPSEERVSFSAMTGQSLFYMGETDLAHKVLSIAEEEGAKRAAYALKLLHSEGELRIASTGKEGSSGRLITHTYTVRGPVAIFLTTTTIELDEELANRCIVLGVDEERSQTQAIHRYQRERETLEGLLAEHERASVLKLHRDAQRLLDPLAVVNPYARALGFADARTRTRRDHTKYLALIRAIALMHQHQRPKKSAATESGHHLPYIEVTRSDIALANRLAHAVLGHSLDELPPGTRRLLGLIDAHVAERAAEEPAGREAVRFTRRELREAHRQHPDLHARHAAQAGGRPRRRASRRRQPAAQRPQGRRGGRGGRRAARVGQLGLGGAATPSWRQIARQRPGPIFVWRGSAET